MQGQRSGLRPGAPAPRTGRHWPPVVEPPTEGDRAAQARFTTLTTIVRSAEVAVPTWNAVRQE